MAGPGKGPLDGRTSEEEAGGGGRGGGLLYTCYCRLDPTGGNIDHLVGAIILSEIVTTFYKLNLYRRRAGSRYYTCTVFEITPQLIVHESCGEETFAE